MARRDSGTTPRASDAAAKWALRAASVGLLALVWEVYARSQRSLLIPTFGATAVAVVEMLASPEFWRAMAISNTALVAGFALALTIGIPLGLVIGRSRLLERMVEPLLNALNVTPMSALIPVFIIALGIGTQARVAVVFAFAVVSVALHTRSGGRYTPESLLAMARSFGANRAQTLAHVVLPFALPHLLTGARLGLARAVTGMVIVELLLVAIGLGALILEYRGNFEAARMFAVVLGVVAEAALLSMLLRRAERALLRWRKDVSV